MTDSVIQSTVIPSFKIVSVSEKRATGITYTKPGQQYVYLGQPIQHWRFHKVGGNTYRLSIGSYGETGVEDGKVVVTVIPKHGLEWEITYQEFHDAYIIALANDPSLGWTVPNSLSGSHEIEVKPIIATHSIPLQYIPTQLFKLVSDD